VERHNSFKGLGGVSPVRVSLHISKHSPYYFSIQDYWVIMGAVGVILTRIQCIKIGTEFNLVRKVSGGVSGRVISEGFSNPNASSLIRF